MNIIISPSAINWFEEEFVLKENEAIRIFVRYGGCGSIQQGFSLGFMKEQADHVAAKTTVEGKTFFITEEDAWYFKDKDVNISFNAATDEIEFLHG